MGKPITQLAREALNAAIASGKVVKPASCEKCGKTPKRLHGHHEDYNKPLKVIWLCPLCHSAEHKRLIPSKHPTGGRFQRQRLKLFTTQQEAADAMGVTVGALCHWEVGRRAIPEYAWILLGYIEREREEV
jgi:DNA-binding transcriptional regulator YiaG